MAPATGESRDAVVSLDALAALAAASIAVALHPVVQQIRAALWFLRLDIGVDAGGRCMLHATLVHRVLANCKRMKSKVLRKMRESVFKAEWILRQTREKGRGGKRCRKRGKWKGGMRQMAFDMVQR